jgi:hypothetical protein
MWLRLLRLAARRPLSAVAVVISAASILVLALVFAMTGLRNNPRPGGEGMGNPRGLIGRPWLDRYPEKSRDEIDLLIFFGSGFGLYEHGSRWRATLEFFEFERQGNAVELTFFQDNKRHKTRFNVVECHDDDNFDLCLDFDSSPRGPKRYRSWGRDGDDEQRLPWLAAWKRAVEQRAKTAASDEAGAAPGP